MLANHGTLSFGSTMQLAFWFTDILDAYCRTLILAKQLGRIHRFDDGLCEKLLDYKQEWGFSDLRIHGPRAGQNVCGHESFGQHWNDAGLSQQAFPPVCPGSGTSNQNGPPQSAPGCGRMLSSDEMEQLAELIAKRLGRV